jgi:hypothetical protein
MVVKLRYCLGPRTFKKPRLHTYGVLIGRCQCFWVSDFPERLFNRETYTTQLQQLIEDKESVI